MPARSSFILSLLPLCLVTLTGCRPQATPAPAPEPAPSRVPLIDCPAIVCSPAAFAGEYVEYQFTVTNPGDADLVVSRVHTNCSCLRIEVHQPDGKKALSGFTLAPGDSLVIHLTESVHLLPGDVQNGIIQMTTNVPEQPQVLVKCVIPDIRGLSLAPTVLVFEPQIVGQSQDVVARVVNTSREAITILGVKNEPDIQILHDDQPLASIPPLQTISAVVVHKPTRVSSGSRSCQLQYRCDRDGAVRAFEFHLSTQVRPEYQLSRTTITLGADDATKKLKQFEQEISRSDGGEFSLKIPKHPHCELELVPGPSKSKYVLRGRVTPPKPGQPLQIPVQLTAVHAGVEKPVRFVVYSID